MPPAINITGQRFGRLVAIRRADSDGRHARWLARCDCGNEIITTGRFLRTGHTQSCGCRKRDLLSARRRRHGESKGSRLYKTWLGMRNRCNNPKSDDYYRYGARGITICPEWDDYISFKQWALGNGYEDGLTIERDNIADGYKPSNCRWIPMTEQAANRSIATMVEYGGKTQCVAWHARDAGMSTGTVHDRLRRGMTLKEALETPLRLATKAAP